MSDRLIEALREELAARGLTQLDVDHGARLGEGHCSAILNKRKDPRLKTMRRIANWLNMDLALVPREPPQEK